MTHPDTDGGREWRPYEVAMPVARDGAALAVPMHMPYMPPRATVGHLRDDGAAVPAARLARLLARLIDTAMAMVPVALIFFAAFRQYRMSTIGLQGLSTGATTAIILALLLLAGLAAWNIVLLVRYGQSVGKRMMNIRIVRPDGSQASFARIFFLRGFPIAVANRLLTLVHPVLGLTVSLVDVLMIFSDSRRCLHDHIADTIVVES